MSSRIGDTNVFFSILLLINFSTFAMHCKMKKRNDNLAIAYCQRCLQIFMMSQKEKEIERKSMFVDVASAILLEIRNLINVLEFCIDSFFCYINFLAFTFLTAVEPFAF